jgi:hypothetical protein
MYQIQGTSQTFLLCRACSCEPYKPRGKVTAYNEITTAYTKIPTTKYERRVLPGPAKAMAWAGYYKFFALI